MNQSRYQLIGQLLWHEVQSKYRGSLLGVVWSVVTPLAMLLVFTFVFGVIFQSRWSESIPDTSSFAIVLFSGLIVFNLFSEAVSKAPSLVVSQRNLVKKVVFPLELLPVVTLLAALVQAAIAFVILFAAQLVVGQGLQLTALLLPIVLLPACLVTLGLCWFLAALGVYMRDLTYILPPIVTALMFLTPVFYPPSALPDWLQPMILLNPLAYAVNDVRSVVVFGQLPAVQVWITGLALCAFVAVMGYAFFMKTRKGFADVL